MFDNTAWCLVDDFNQIITGYDCQEGRLRNPRSAQRMIDALQSRNLTEINASGPRYTWSNHHFRGHLVMKKLDRCFANMTWRTYFEEGIVNVLPKTRSDHNPLLIRLFGIPPPQHPNRPFRFEAAWLTHPTFPKMLKESWNSGEDLASQ